MHPRLAAGLRVGAVLLGAAALFWLVPVAELKEWFDPEVLRARGEAGGPGIVLSFLGIAAVLMLMTGQLALPVIGGATLFGPWLGPVLALVGVAFGATGQFWTVRYALRAPAEALLLRRAPALRATLEQRGLGLLVLLRFVWFPAFLVNIGAALTPMPTRSFLIGFPAMLPQAMLWAYATDAIVTHGLGDVPLRSWVTLGMMVAAAAGAYLWAVRRWPQLAAIAKKPSKGEGASSSL